jgi:hypothetical protein
MDFIHNVEEVFEMDVQGFLFYSPLIEFVFLSTKGLCRLFSTNLVVNCKKFIFLEFVFLSINSLVILDLAWVRPVAFRKASISFFRELLIYSSILQ